MEQAAKKFRVSLYELKKELNSEVESKVNCFHSFPKHCWIFNSEFSIELEFGVFSRTHTWPSPFFIEGVSIKFIAYNLSNNKKGK